MPRIIQTNPDGSSISNYLTQSARGRPFQLGRVNTTPSGILYGYSGNINYDLTASATYNMMDFQLERDAFLKAEFNADWASVEGSNADVGFQIDVDGTTVGTVSWSRSNWRLVGSIPAWAFSLYVPANKQCRIFLTNLNASNLAVVNANCTLTGEYK
jgi:hypothetical protein